MAYQLDVTDRAAVDEFATAFQTIGVLVNNAGGALGADPVATGDPADWRTMYETNVIGTLNLTQALLPKLIAGGDGVIVVVSSTAGHGTYEGGGGCVAAKHGAHVPRRDPPPGDRRPARPGHRDRPRHGQDRGSSR